MKFNLILICYLFVVGACNKKVEKNSDDYVVDAAPVLDEAVGYSSGDGVGATENQKVRFTPPEMEGTYAANFSVGSNQITENKAVNKKMIIKDGNLSFKTKNLAKAKTQIDSSLKKYGAYYDKEEFNNNDQESSFSLSIRIPATYFESFVRQIENSELELLTKSITARDVTTEFIDTETRLNNKKGYLKKYQELLSRANSIKDILQLQENIRVLQEEIESSEGQLKYLSDQVSYSTLNLQLVYQKDYVYKPQNQDSFFELLKRSLTTGWQSVKNMVLLFIQSWPYLLIAVVILTWFKKRKRKKANS
jgi:hypothetical protein